MIKRFLQAVALASLSVSAVAEKPSIDKIVEMPIDGMIAIKDTNGQLFFASRNYRYVIKGEVFDAWTGKTLLTIEQVSDSVHSVNLDRMGVDVDDLGALSWGNGAKEVIVFTDPQCNACQQLIDDITPELLDQYTFKFMVVPALGGNSRDLSKRVACHEDKKQAFEYLKTKSLSRLPEAKDCNFDTYNRMLITTDVIGVKEIPFLIRQDGAVLRGKPKNLSDWLKAE